MHSSSYTREVGMDSSQRVVPWPIAVGLLVAMAVGLWYSTRALQTRVEHRESAEKITAAATAPLPPKAGLAKK